MNSRIPPEHHSNQSIFNDLAVPPGFVVLATISALAALSMRILAAVAPEPWRGSLVYATAGVFLLGSFALSLKRPGWTLPLAVTLIPLQYALFLPWFGYRLTPSEVLVLTWLLVAAWDVLQSRRKIHIPDTSINLLLLAYVLALALSVGGVRFYFSDAALRAVLLEFVAQVYLVVFLLLLVSAMAGRDQVGGNQKEGGIQFVVGAWALAASFAGLAALLAILHYPFGLFAFDSPLPLVSETHKVTGLFRNSNAFASFALVSLLVFGGLLLYGQPSPKRRRLLVALTLLLALGLTLTRSQGAWGGLVAGLVLLALPKLVGGTKRMRQLLALSFAGLVAIGLFLLSGYPIRSLPGWHLAAIVASMAGYEIERFPQRLVVLNLHRGNWQASPLFGVGIGGLKAYTAWLTGGDLARGAHTAIVGVTAETGLIGLVVVALLGIAIVRRSLFNLRWEAGRWLPLAIGLAAAFIGHQVYGLSHDVRGEKHLWLMLALILGIYLDYRRSNPTCASGDTQSAARNIEQMRVFPYQRIELPCEGLIFSLRSENNR